MVAALAVIGSLAITIPVFAGTSSREQNDNGQNIEIKTSIGNRGVEVKAGGDNQNKEWNTDSESMKPSLVGKVSAINGNTLTVISNGEIEKDHNASTTTFTVNVTNAKLLRGNTAITLSDITVGDNVVIQGVVTGNNVVATIVRDGKVGNGDGNNNDNDKNGSTTDNNKALLQIQGNGQPVVAGTVTVINNPNMTITTGSGITYTINVATAKIIQGNATTTLSSVKVGDAVIVQGTVNGISVVASTIIDTNRDVNKAPGQNTRNGFFGSIGQFFKHLFGF